MDQRSPIDLYQAAVKIAFDIVSEATLARRLLPPSEPRDHFEKFAVAVESKTRLVFMFAVIFFVAGMGCGILGRYFHSRLLINFLAGMLSASVLLCLLFMLAVSLPRIPSLIKFFRAPSKPFLQLVRYSLLVEKPYLDRLKCIDVNAVRHVLLHYRNERNAMEKRGAAFSGSIDRLGVLPALAGVALMYSGLKALSVSNEWVQILIPLILIFHFFNFMAIGLYQKFDRIIVMLETSISTRD